MKPTFRWYLFSPEYQWDLTRLLSILVEVIARMALVWGFDFAWCRNFFPAFPWNITTSWLQAPLPLPVALVIPHRKPCRFYTYAIELLDCNIASHIFFVPRLIIEMIVILDIVFTGKTISACCMFILHFLQLPIREWVMQK